MWWDVKMSHRIGFDQRLLRRSIGILEMNMGSWSVKVLVPAICECNWSQCLWQIHIDKGYQIHLRFGTRFATDHVGALHWKHAGTVDTEYRVVSEQVWTKWVKLKRSEKTSFFKLQKFEDYSKRKKVAWDYGEASSPIWTKWNFHDSRSWLLFQVHAMWMHSLFK
jgi:hypothetical protein